jgi:hypothetical protein
MFHYEQSSRYGQSERNRTLAKERENKRNFRLGCLMIVAPLLLFLTLAFISKKSYAQSSIDNTIYVSQIGDNNTINITQYGSGHSATVNLGLMSNVDNTSIAIDQKDSGPKLASISIPSGVNNGVNMLQQGSGSHSALLTNLNGSGNNINIDQNGAGNHALTVIGTNGSTNSGNTITSSQSGGTGADKTFTLTLDGATGATVGIQQTNSTQSNQGSMSIQCMPGTCGSWSYIRN